MWLNRSEQTVAIEQMLQGGQSISSVARQMGLTRQRVQQIRKRIAPQDIAPPASGSTSLIPSNSSMKSFTLRLTTPVFDALTEACAITNRKDHDDPITLEDYVEECLTARLVELGLLRKYRRK